LTDEILDYIQHPVEGKKCRIAGKERIRCNDYFFLTNSSLEDGGSAKSTQGQTHVPAKCARKPIVMKWYKHACEESKASYWSPNKRYCTTISLQWWQIFSGMVECPASESFENERSWMGDRQSVPADWLAEQEQKVASLQNDHYFTPYDQWISLSDAQEYLQVVLEGEKEYLEDVTSHGGDHEAMMLKPTEPWESRTLRAWDAERLGLKFGSEELRQALEDEKDTKAKRVAFSQRAVKAAEVKLEVVTAYVADLKGYVQRWKDEGQGDGRFFKPDHISTSDEALDAAAYIIRRYQWSKACTMPVKLSQINLHLPK